MPPRRKSAGPAPKRKSTHRSKCSRVRAKSPETPVALDPKRPPKTPTQLRRLAQRAFGIVVPPQAICTHHGSPLDYLAASFFRQSDLLVWANRGGGKTLLAAVATILDAVYRAPARILVLGGSFDQSDRLAEYIRMFLRTRSELIDGRMTRQRVRLVGGSEIRMLAQSQQAVRGQHVQKIRCDEVELFDEEVWRAVQFSTRSRRDARGSIEVLSTLHRAGGIMQTLVDRAIADGGGTTARGAGAGYRLINWCLWEVIERCPPSRKCNRCPLAEDCRGAARKASGFLPIDDAIAIRARSSRASWETEMLCRGAKRDWLVFGEFDPARHVAPVDYCADFPTYRAIDFGYTSPLVCLWVQTAPGGSVHVIGEYVCSRRPMTHHAAEILRRGRELTGGEELRVQMTYVDPAGRQREASSGAACTEILAAAGIPCTWRASTINEGIELVRAALAPADGRSRLRIAPRCRRLVEAFNSYHYPAPETARGADDRPVKDGPDHLIDALRYFFVNRMRPRLSTKRKTY